MPRPDITTALRESGFFSDTSDELVAKIARMSKFESYRKGELIFAEDNPCGGMYVVVSGAVKVYKIGPDGREHILHVAEPGDTFGEVAMFLGKGYPAYAGAVKDSLTVFVRRQPLIDLLERSPDLCFEILGSLAAWTHRLVNKLENLTLHDASARLAQYLLSRTKPSQGVPEVVLTVPKQTLAAHLGISSETLSRLINRMEAAGVIAPEGRIIRIPDRAGLESVAENGLG